MQMPFQTFIASQSLIVDSAQTAELVAATVEEVAAWLSAAEGRVVTVQEVRRIEFQALRKLRKVLYDRGYRAADLVSEG